MTSEIKLGKLIGLTIIDLESNIRTNYPKLFNLLNDIFYGKGISSEITGTYNMFSMYSLDMYDRLISKVISRIIDMGIKDNSSDDEITALISIQMSNMIYNKYYQKWQHQYDALALEYDIIKPYDMTIGETEKNILKTTTDIDQTNSGSYTDSDSLTSHNTENEGSIYSFTSTDTPVHTDKNTESETRQGSTVGSNSGIRNVDTKYDSTRDIDKETTRKGNTGNIPNQELIEREIKLRDTMIYKIIYKDLNELLTRSVYNY